VEYHVFAGFHRDWKISHLKNQNTTGLNCSALSPQVGISAPVNDVFVKMKTITKDQDGLTKQDIAGVRDVPCDRTIIVERTIIPRTRARLHPCNLNIEDALNKSPGMRKSSRTGIARQSVKVFTAVVFTKAVPLLLVVGNYNA